MIAFANRMGPPVERTTRIFDATGREVAVVQVEPDGRVFAHLRTPDGSIAVSASLGPNGPGAMFGDGQPGRFAVNQDESGMPIVYGHDPTGRQYVLTRLQALAVDEQGNPLGLLDG